MLRRDLIASVLGLGLVVFLGGCGGNNSAPTPPTPPTSGTPVSLTFRDTPPTGVTVLSFEITVTGAVLQPGNVSLVSTPVNVEVEKLQTETAYLNSASAAPGNYSSIAVTFAKPELTILNNSGGAIGTCANGSTCELTPSLSQASVTYSGAPFPVTITAGSPIGLTLDFNLNASLQSDLSVNPTVTFSQPQPSQGSGELEELDDVAGQVSTVDTTNNQFNFNITDGRSLTIKVDSNTQFENFENIGLTNAFSSVAASQILAVDLELMAGGTFLAKQVELEDKANEDDLEGTIVSVVSPTQFQIVVLDEVPQISGVVVGNEVTVTIQSGASFSFEAEGLPVPSTASFGTSADLMVGQDVEVRSLTGSTGTSIFTDRVVLRMSQITATVQSVTGTNFIVNNLPSLFTVPAIQVLTSSETEFEGVSGVTALNTADTVSVRGLLFNTAGQPQLVAKKVRKL